MSKRLAKLELLREETEGFGKIRERGIALASSAYPHFPNVAKEAIELEADLRDNLLRNYIQGSAILLWRRIGRINHATVEYGHSVASAKAIRRLAEAIHSRDPWRFRKAEGEIPRDELSRLHRRMTNPWREHGETLDGGFVSLGELTTIAFASLFFCDDDDLFWTFAEEAVRAASCDAASRRRPPNLVGDHVALELATMWSAMAKQPITLPRSKDGTSELGGPMIAFVRDAAKVYPEVSISFSSTSSWARILRPYLS